MLEVTTTHYLVLSFILCLGFYITPAILGALFAVVAWGRWPQTKALATAIKA